MLESELDVVRVYLKKAARVVGMVHAHLLAKVVEALIERTVRESMQREDIDALPLLPEGGLTETPTTPRVLEAFSNVCWHEFERGGETVAFAVRLTSLQTTMLRLLGTDRTAYE